MGTFGGRSHSLGIIARCAHPEASLVLSHSLTTTASFQCPKCPSFIPFLARSQARRLPHYRPHYESLECSSQLAFQYWHWFLSFTWQLNRRQRYNGRMYRLSKTRYRISPAQIRSTATMSQTSPTTSIGEKTLAIPCPKSTRTMGT